MKLTVGIKISVAAIVVLLGAGTAAADQGEGSIVSWGALAVGDLRGTFVAVSSRFDHSLALKDDGSVVGWGWNSDGQCDVPAPNAGFVAVAAGNDHGLGLKADGSIVGWGRNNHGQINVPAPNTDFAAVAAGSAHSLGLKADGSVVAWGSNNWGQCDVPAPNEDFIAVAGGLNYSLGLKADGSVVAWGRNDYGQLDVPTPNEDFVAVAAGRSHNLGLKAGGSVVAWGLNDDGQCDVPAPNEDFVAVSPGSAHSLGLKANGSVVFWGQNEHGAGDVPAPNTDFVAVAAGFRYGVGLKADGSVVAWGWNLLYQCNIPASNEDFVAVDPGGEHTLGLKIDGSVVAWGDCSGGLCDVPEPNTDFVAVDAGWWNHSLGLKTNGSVVAWGYCSGGVCDVPEPNEDFVAVAGGGNHSLGLKADGSVAAWGNNNYGQLDVPEPNTDFSAVAAGYYHSLGLKDDGSVAAWGRNNDGQLDVPAPNENFVAVACGEEYSLGLKADGSIVAWGLNEYGQCDVPEPNTDFVAVAAGFFHSLGLTVDGAVVGWGGNWFGQSDAPVPNTGFIAVAAGYQHTLAVVLSAPRVVAHNPAEYVDWAIDHISVTFGGTINENTFTAEDVEIIGPEGPIIPDPPIPPTEPGDYTWQISFASQSTYGEYHVYIGPHIEDAGGKEMDQDRDGIEGEDPDDIYDAAFTIVNVQELSLGELFADGFSETGEARFFSIAAAAGQDLEIQLDDLDGAGLNELYASFENIPTRSEFEYRGTTLPVADQLLRIPGTLSGTYYILAYASDVPEPGPSEFAILADLLPLSITNVVPDQGWNADTDPPITTIYGSGFNPDATALLDREGQEDIPATDVTWLDPSRLFARFDVQGAEPGAWELTVTNPDATSASYPFEVLAGGPAILEANMILPSALRRNSRVTLWIEYENIGEADMPAPIFHLTNSASAPMRIGTNGRESFEGLALLGVSTDGSPGTLIPGHPQSIAISFVVPAAGEISFELTALVPDGTPVDWDEFEPLLRPLFVEDSEWDAYWEWATSQMGVSWLDVANQLSLLLDDMGDAIQGAIDLVGVLTNALSIVSQSDEQPACCEGVSWEDWDPAQDVTISGEFDPANECSYIITHGMRSCATDFAELQQKISQHCATCNVLTIDWQRGACVPLWKPWKAGTRAIEAGQAARARLLEQIGEESFDWSSATYIGHSFGNSVNKAMADDGMPGPRPGRAIVLDPANPIGFSDIEFAGAYDGGAVAAGTGSWFDAGPCFPYARRVADYHLFLPSLDHGGALTCFTDQVPSDADCDNSWLTRTGPEWGLPASQPGAYSGLITCGGDPYGSPIFDCRDFPFQMPGSLIAAITTPIIQPVDPNEKTAPAGFGESGFVTPGQLIAYTIYCENEPEAQAAALEIHITDQLEVDLDWTTFELSDMGFGPYGIAVPVGLTHYETSIEVDGWTWNKEEGWHTGETPLNVDFVADMDISTGQVSWDLVSYDPETGKPPEDPYAGFLPPNDSDEVPHRGEGYFMFRIGPMAGSPTGTQITNMADIVFDSNDPIPTPSTLNTIDAGAPSSSVTELPPTTETFPFTVEWSGQDGEAGSGIATYDLFVAVDGGAFGLLLSTPETSAVLNGQTGHTYAFYTVATDHVGHREDAPAEPDATTTVVISNIPPICDIDAPTSVECQGETTAIPLDGSGSVDPEGGEVFYLWDTDCLGGSFDDPTSGAPMLTIDTDCMTSMNCDVTLTVTDEDDASNTCFVTVTIVDPCPADFDGDGDVDATDLAELLGSWGPCSGCPQDIDGDDAVGAFDLALLLGAWGPCE